MSRLFMKESLVVTVHDFADRVRPVHGEEVSREFTYAFPDHSVEVSIPSAFDVLDSILKKRGLPSSRLSLGDSPLYFPPFGHIDSGADFILKFSRT
ncbi:MAG: hypothetical protein A3G59_01095 [Candidatus Taylorbacteria bacterium RIFCSPLOWO2_12_FULL_47_20]|uniref:Uncharacterized protein n=1 Tax=Candidatus Taylorbacteria bacterium RIFCSPLOWO2_12_FULL_47_20 TaxID=1802335 RepID=A0A1G2P8U0_9BACT|nr:MAG: hypothetical protein A3G59_01095 [Candidatus Taylorbacteria bacterium RIFCSPLOWO2_12_FULL_47_20]